MTNSDVTLETLSADEIEVVTEKSSVEEDEFSSKLDEMEKGFDLAIDDEVGHHDDLEAREIQADYSAEVRAHYQREGSPDYFNFVSRAGDRLADRGTVDVVNDWYLEGAPPISLHAASVAHSARLHEGWTRRSAYDAASYDYTDSARRLRPMHGHTEGGKGLALYPSTVRYHTCAMSTIVNISISFGCPASSFPEESELNYIMDARGQQLPLGAILKRTEPMPGQVLTYGRKYIPISSIVQHGNKDCYIWTDRLGNMLECTPDHPVLTRIGDQWLIRPILECFEQDLWMVYMAGGQPGPETDPNPTDGQLPEDPAEGEETEGEEVPEGEEPPADEPAEEPEAPPEPEPSEPPPPEPETPKESSLRLHAAWDPRWAQEGVPGIPAAPAPPPAGEEVSAGGIDYEALTATLDQQNLQTQPLYLVKIANRQPSGVKRVADLEVTSPDHLYAVNGLLVHNCSFCKESLLSRGYTEVSVTASTGMIRFPSPLTGNPITVSSAARVKFRDGDRIVIGSIGTAIRKGFPVAEDSLEKLEDHHLKARTLYD